MRELLSGLVMFALLAATSVLAIEVLHDRETVVPPPDAIAEQFIRAVMAKRWEPAKEYLQDPESMSDEELAALQKELGEGQNVEAETVSRDDEKAVVTVRLPERGLIKKFELEFESGQWAVTTSPYAPVRFPIHSSETR